MEKIKNAMPWVPGRGKCFVWELLIGGFSSLHEDYTNMINKENWQIIFGPEGCQTIQEILDQMQEWINSWQTKYDNNNCEEKLHGQQAQSVPLSGSTTPVESSSCPYSEDTTQQLSQEPLK